MTWFFLVLRDPFLEKRVSKFLCIGQCPLVLAGVILVAWLGADARGESIMLSWSDNSGNESGFKIERSIDGIRFEEIAVVGSNVTTFEDRNGLELKRHYSYRVRAYNEYGNSGYSETATMFYDPKLRFYFGELGLETEGSFAIMTRGDGSGVFVGEIGSSVSVVVIEEFELAENGEFSISLTNIGVLSGVVIEDRVFGDLEFFGASSGLLLRGAFEAQNGVTEGVAGFYDLGKGVEERLAILVGPNGRGFVVSESGNNQSAGVIGLDKGISTVLLDDGLELSLSIGNLSGEVDAAAVRGDDSEDAARSAFSNFSVRLPIDGGATAIAGFVVSGPGEKRLLVRAVGPTLRDLGVGNAAGDMRLSLYRKGQEGFLAENDDWWDVEDQGANVAHVGMIAGAFSLNTSSKDAAFVISVSSGVYWAYFTNETQDAGTALIEIYDLDELRGVDTDTNLVNLSLRGVTGYGSEPIIAGFVISGDDPRGLMFRAMGRELQAFGVSNTLDDPRFNVFGMGGGMPIAGNDDWTLDREFLSDLAAYVGAFPFEDGSKSAAQALWLDPGLYTAIATGNGFGSGEMLIEMYAIPIGSAKQ